MMQSDGFVRAQDKSKIERDLGTMIDDGLTFSEHIHRTANKANGIMAVIRSFSSVCCSDHLSDLTWCTECLHRFLTK